MDKTFTARQWGWKMDVIGLVLYMKKLWPREAQLPAHKHRTGRVISHRDWNVESWVPLEH